MKFQGCAEYNTIAANPLQAAIKTVWPILHIYITQRLQLISMMVLGSLCDLHFSLRIMNLYITKLYTCSAF